MLQRGWIGVVVAAGLLTGCAPKKPPTTSPADDPAHAGVHARFGPADQLKRANPNTEVGSVVAVVPEANLAAVSDVPTANFRIGDPITFLDENLGDLTLGTVVAVVNGRLLVRYDAPPAGHRVPQVGDFAVHIFNSAVAAPQSTATVPLPRTPPRRADIPGAGCPAEAPPLPLRRLLHPPANSPGRG